MSIALDPALVSELAARVSGPCPRAGGFGLRRGSEHPQRADRPQAGADRPLPGSGRRRRCSRPRPQGRARGLGARRRPQRRRARGHGWWRDDRPRRDEADRGRSRGGDGHCGRGRDLGRAERRCGRARAGRDRRRDLDHRDRGLHPRWRPRLADGQARPGVGQSARRRARHGRRPGARRQRGFAPRPLLGAQGRRRELRRRDLVHLSDASAADDRGRVDRPPDRRRARAASLLPRRRGDLLGRPHRLDRARACAGRLGPQARCPGRLPYRRPGGRRARARAVQDLGLAADGRGRADAVPGDEHASRRRLPRQDRSTTGSRASFAG